MLLVIKLIDFYGKGYWMAQIKSQKKRILTNEKARLANSSARSSIRTACKKVTKAVEAKNLEEAKALLKEAVSLIDSSVSSGLQHQNTANRQKSHLTKLVHSLEVEATQQPA